MNETPTICLLGIDLECPNLGVRALAHSLIGLTDLHMTDARIVIFCGAPRPSVEHVRIGDRLVKVEIVNHRLSPRARLRDHILWILAMAFVHRLAPIPPLRRWIARRVPAIGMLMQSTLVGDIRGGDSFSDIYGLARLITGSLPCAIALLLRRRLVMLPQTYGPFASRTARAVARFTLARAAAVYTRDRQGIETVRRLLPSKPVHATFCPDVAYTLPATPVDASRWPASLAGRVAPLFGINVSGLLNIGGYTHDDMFGLRSSYPEFVQGLINRVMTQTNADLLLVPHQFGPEEDSDLLACRNVWTQNKDRYPGRIHLWDAECTQSEIKSVIGRCAVFVGSRMHACIAALSQGVPCIGVAYSPKFSGVFDAVEAGHLVMDARTTDAERIVDAAMDCWREREAIRRRLTANAAAVREKVNGVFSGLLNGKTNSTMLCQPLAC